MLATSNCPYATCSAVLKLLAPLIPELYSTYYYIYHITITIMLYLLLTLFTEQSYKEIGKPFFFYKFEYLLMNVDLINTDVVNFISLFFFVS